MAFFDSPSARERDAAAFYEDTAEPLTAQCIRPAFELVGEIAPGMSVLDVAAGPGGLSVAAAKLGAHVLATDISASMVARLQERLAPYPKCSAAVEDAQDLDLTSTFDVSFSMFGVINLPGWRRGLRELARVTRPGGYSCVSSWRDPRTVASVGLFVEAMTEIHPGREVIPLPEGITTAADPVALQDEMQAAGFIEVTVRPVEVAWQWPSVETFTASLDQLYGFMPAYVELSTEDRDRLLPAIERAAGHRAGDDGVIRSLTIAHLAAGRVPETQSGSSSS
jgi:ubiquinone/menaquinone biosynthesis C-methylase UbiE